MASTQKVNAARGAGAPRRNPWVALVVLVVVVVVVVPVVRVVLISVLGTHAGSEFSNVGSSIG